MADLTRSKPGMSLESAGHTPGGGHFRTVSSREPQREICENGGSEILKLFLDLHNALVVCRLVRSRQELIYL